MRFILTDNIPNPTVEFDKLEVGEKVGDYFRYTGMTETEPSIWCKISDSRGALLKGPYNVFGVGSNEFFPNKCETVPLTLTVEK